jgi:hypothetical protein
MRKHLFAVPAVALALGLVAAAPAQAAPGHGNGHGTTNNNTTKIKPIKADRSNAPAIFLTAQLNGLNEVPPADGKKAGDKDGSAVAFLKVKGNRVTYSLKWKGISAPTLGHLHQGVAGVNGAVAVTLFGSAMPEGVNAAVGAGSFEDPALAKALRTNPAGFYFNVHTAEFPGGAVRGQFKRVNKPVNLFNVIRGGGLRAMADGEQEVPAPPAVTAGDLDGHASAFVRTNGAGVQYSLAWVGIAAPTLGHIHQGKKGVNGAVKVGLFTTAIPANVFAVSGNVASPDAAVIQQLRKSPKDFYVNLHNAEFKDGAVRGQLFR